MAFYDPQLMSQASQKLGGTYQAPVAPAPTAATGTPAPMAGQAPAPAPAVQQASDPEVPPGAAPPADGGMDLSAMQKGADAATKVKTGDEKTDEGVNKLGNLVGTVLSFYTGNYAGGAQGVMNMQNQGKQEQK